MQDEWDHEGSNKSDADVIILTSGFIWNIVSSWVKYINHKEMNYRNRRASSGMGITF